MKRRRLSDLYVRGKEVTIDDGTDDAVTIWLQKLNGVDRESCLRRSHAAKARYMSEADQEDSELFQAVFSQIRVMERDDLVGLIVAEDLAKYRQRVEAERSADEETWGKENYLQGLVDAWIGDENEGGLAAIMAQDPEDPDVKRVDAELKRFEEEVLSLVRVESDRLILDWGDAPEETVWKRATSRLLDLRSTDAFGAEFERQQLFYSVRDPDDHAKRYFGTLTELDDLDDAVRKKLVNEYNELMVSPIEGKDLRASQPSSNSSDPLPVEEASADSGPQVVSA
jgi:hypothetical protein